MQLEKQHSTALKSNLAFVRDYAVSPLAVEDRIDLLAEITRFSTYKNLSLVVRKESESESIDQNSAVHDSDKDFDDMDIEFIGKRAYTKEQIASRDPAQQSAKKVKPVFSKQQKQTNDRLEDAIR